MKRRLLALLIITALVLSLGSAALAVAPPSLKEDLTGKIVILHTNDTHGFDVAAEDALGMANIAQLKKDYQTQGAYVLLLDAGDFSQGRPLVNLSGGEKAVEFMNAAGYDAATVGNHEFDYGFDTLKKNLEIAKFRVLAANVLSGGAPAFGDRTVFTAPDGTKIGVFGLDTPQTPTSTNPNNVKGLTFLAGEELYKCAQAQVDALRTEGCKLVICLGHLGVEASVGENRSTEVLKNVKGIDLFIDGHSHTVIDGNAAENNFGGAMLVSTGCYFANIGVVVADGEKLTAGLVTVADYSGTDDATAELIDATNDEIQKQLSEVFCTSTVDLDGEKDPGVRTQETNLGDFSADAILWAARQMTGEDIQGSIVNGGGIRVSIPAGEITLNDIKTLFPFNNTVAVVTLSGADLLETLAMATFCTPVALGAFPQVSGITYTINTWVEYQNGDAYSTYFRCLNSGERITDVTVGGKPLDLDATYKIVSNDFNAAGGDTYYNFSVSPSENTGIFLEDAVFAFVDAELDGVIGEEYALPQGRIKIVTEKPADAPVTPTPTPTPAPTPAVSVQYTVVAGDTLWLIAQRQLGSGTLWKNIYSANADKIRNPNLIFVGQKLDIKK